MSDTDIELPSIMNGYRLTPEEVRRVAQWMREHANTSDVEDCEACAVIEEDYCPVHYGIGLGQYTAIEAATAAVKGVLR